MLGAPAARRTLPIDAAMPVQMVATSGEIRKTRDELCSILAEHSGKPFEKVLADADRDFWMTSQEALEYGMIDNILKGKKRA